MNKPSDANGFMLGFIIYSGLLPFALIFAAGFMGINISDLESILTLFQHLLIFAVPIAFYCLVTGNKLRDIVPHEPLSVGNIALILLIALFTIPLMLWVGTITDFFIEDDMNETVNEIVENNSMTYLITAIAVMPGVFEELMFRGVIMTGYKRMGIVKSSVAAAVLFGIMHLSLTQLFYAAAAGVVFGILVHYSNSIYSSMLAHFVINGIQAAASKLASSSSIYDAEEAAEELSKTEIFAGTTVLLVVTLPVLILLLFAYIYLNRGKNVDYKYSLTPKKEFVCDMQSGRGRIIDVKFVLVIVFYCLYVGMMSFFK